MALVLAAPALADDEATERQQIALELREVAAFERSVERALAEDLEWSTSAVTTREFDRQGEQLARLFRFRRDSVPADIAER